MKKSIILIALLVLVMSAMFAFNRFYLSKLESQKCGDNVCDIREKSDANLCPQDCKIEKKEDIVSGVGTIKYYSLEGGFFGILADSGAKYLPTNLADEFKKDGLLIIFKVKKQEAKAGIQIWGESVEVIEINKKEAVSQRDIAANSPFGVHPAPVTSLKLDNPFSLATDIGVKWDRPALYFFWTLVAKNPKNTEFNWDRYDKYLQAMPQSMMMMGNIAIGSPLKDGATYEMFAKSKKSFLPKDEVYYKKFVEAVVERYDGDGIEDMPNLKNPIKYWQVDNEPPHAMTDYAQFLKISYEAIKQADGGAKVLIGGVPGMPPLSAYLDSFDKYFLPILQDLSKIEGRYFDVLDHHWYGDATGDYSDMKKAYEYIDGKIKSLGIDYDEVWITEMGTYSGDPKGVNPLAGLIDYPKQTEGQQAIDVVKRYVYPLSFGVKKIFLAFGLIEGFKYDQGYFDFTGLIYDGRFNSDLGSGVKKLSYYAYKKMVETLEDSDWSNIKTIQEKDGVYVYRLLKHGAPIYVAWNDNQEEKQVTIYGVDSSEVRITEAVPKYETGKELADYSTAFETETRKVDANKIIITLKDKPVFVEGR